MTISEPETLLTSRAPAEEALSRQTPRLRELPFDSRRKRMSTVHRVGSEQVAYIKGAPKEVLARCSRIRLDGKQAPLGESLRAEILAANDEYARAGLRVLAIAARSLPAGFAPFTPEALEQDLTLLGLVAMFDPPRPEVAEAVQKCHQAGIRIVMITGDYGLTALSIARRIGIVRSQQPRILTGLELDTLSDEALQAALQEEVIFARVAPEHKLRVVAALQRAGQVVAVTGSDETNLVVTNLARLEFAVPRTIARVNNPKNAWMLTPEMGVDVALNPSDLMAHLIAEEMSLGDMMTLLKLRRGQFSLVEERLNPAAPAAGKAVGDLELPAECNLAAILRGGQLLLPKPDLVLRPGDEVLAVVHSDHAPALAALLGSR